MNQNMIPGERLYPCPSCAEPTIVRDRAYTTDGYPYVHECPPLLRKVPNERDFCMACRTLCWASLCEACQQRSVAEVAPAIGSNVSGPSTPPVHLYKSKGMGRAW